MGIHPNGHVLGGHSAHLVVTVLALVPTSLSYYLVEQPILRRFKGRFARASILPRTTADLTVPEPTA